MQFSHKKGAAPFELPRDAELQHDRLPANSQILLSGSDIHMICKLSSSSTILRNKSGGKCAIESPELKHVPMSGNICVLDIELSLQKRARRSCDGTVNDHTKRKAGAASSTRQLSGQYAGSARRLVSVAPGCHVSIRPCSEARKPTDHTLGAGIRIKIRN